MAVDLSVPLSWTKATGDAAVMLDELQPNILKAHVRDFLTTLFVHFSDPAEGKSFLRAPSTPTSARPIPAVRAASIPPLTSANT